MALTQNDGGPAFPAQGDFSPVSGKMQRMDFDGMSLRDYFAGQALSQEIEHERQLRSMSISPANFRYDKVAEAAYLMADAMLAERQKTGPADPRRHAEQR